MSYKILYDPELNRKFPVKKDNRAGIGWVVSLFVLAVFLIMVAIPGVSDSVKQWVMPGDLPATEAAFTGFVGRLKAGEGMSEAFTDFCIEILQDGN